jgi:hypothetical protein
MITSTCDSIKKAVLGFFTIAQIIDAKDLLWTIGDKEIVKEKISRRHSNMRSEAEAHLSDILSAMYKLDKADKMPLFVLDYKSLATNCIPKSPPRELDDITVCDRLNNIEEKFAVMQSQLDSVLSENWNLKQSKINQQSYANALVTPSLQARAHDVVKDKVSPLHNSLNVPKSNSLAVTINRDKKDKEDNDDFVIPSYHRKKLNKPNSVMGKSKKDSVLKGAPEPSRLVCFSDR